VADVGPVVDVPAVPLENQVFVTAQVVEFRPDRIRGDFELLGQAAKVGAYAGIEETV